MQMPIPFREISRAEMRKRLQDTFYEKETSKLLKGLGEDCRSKPQALELQKWEVGRDTKKDGGSWHL